MNATRIKSLLLALLLGLSLGLSGCSSAPQEAVRQEPMEEQRSKAKKVPEGLMDRAPAPAGAPAKESDDMERLD